LFTACCVLQVTRAILALKVQEQQLLAVKKQAMAGINTNMHGRRSQHAQLQLQPARKVQQNRLRLQSNGMQQASILQSVVPTAPTSMLQLQQVFVHPAAVSAASLGSYC
jgi:hypothetical protein